MIRKEENHENIKSYKICIGGRWRCRICSCVDSERGRTGECEAAAVFDGVKPSEMRGGTWKVVYSSAEGPHGRARGLRDPRRKREMQAKGT
jgi:hypothetical protein